jgi:NAD(P)-dependent dehydrogenase (short-subunit alcohol dehydrogenase family)
MWLLEDKEVSKPFGTKGAKFLPHKERHMKLLGKVAVVTGGAMGNGFAIAKLLAEEGADIVIPDVCKEETMAQSIENIKQLGRKAIGIRCDISKPSDVEIMVQMTYDTFGRIDILVNNAGIASMTMLVDMTEEEWDRVVDVDLKGAFLCCKYVIPKMIEQGSGKVINIASVGGRLGFGMGTHYCAAKHGLIGLTESLAIEVALHNINVNAICPGTIWTPMMQAVAESFGLPTEEAKREFLGGQLFKDREITPEDIGKAVVWLASDDSRCVTGESVTVDAGWACHAL